MGNRREVAIGLGCYGAYLAVRRAVMTDDGRARAMENAARVVRLEQRLHIDIEPAVQTAAARHHRMIQAVNLGYGAGNVMMSVGWLILLHRDRSVRFGPERRAAVAAFMGALPVFWAFPTAPPRHRDEYTDTLLDGGVDLDHPLLVRLYNPIAAMPSHHVAFAVVTGFGRAAGSRTGLGRNAWRCYPLGVTGAVLATGNHFLLDAVAGALLGALARTVTR
ncbi:MAG: phosphatase PAP2 family protein [Acidimicrobiia bacterium]|nr:phosphatase PAP2 family protein [Acidimicrobiia bacterium]